MREESAQTRAKRLLPLAQQLAEREEFSMPTEEPHYGLVANRYLLVERGYDRHIDGKRHGCSKWADKPADLAAMLRSELDYKGSRRIELYDVERQERIYFKVAVQIDYQAVARLTETSIFK